MRNANQSRQGAAETEVKKPFLKGAPLDENTLRNSLAFFGILIVIVFVSFIACASASFDIVILRVLLNLAVVLVCGVIFYNNGAGRGAEAVTRGEILYQRQEKGQTFSESERKICFHPAKGFLIGVIGSLPFLIAALILAVNTTVQTTGSGTLPSWMQAYIRRSDIGGALVNYTQPDGMNAVDYLRAFIRICILPFVNMIGYNNKYALLTIERLSPLILLIPAVSYGTGYMTGRKIRTRIHTVISENDRKRIRKENKRKKMRSSRVKEPEQLN